MSEGLVKLALRVGRGAGGADSLPRSRHLGGIPTGVSIAGGSVDVLSDWHKGISLMAHRGALVVFFRGSEFCFSGGGYYTAH